MTDKTEKKPLTVSFKNIVIQIVIMVFFTGTWLAPLLFNLANFNIGYFLFMFGGLVLSILITLYSKANPEQPIPKKPTQHLGNLIKGITDIIANVIGQPNQPQVQEFKDIITKVLIWSLREAKISPESFDRKTLEEAETYIFDKLFPKKEDGETESPSTG